MDGFIALRLRDLPRKAALSIPRVRRFYDYARSTQDELAERAASYATLQQEARKLARERDDLGRELLTARAALEAASQDSRRVGEDLNAARAGLQSAAREKETLARERDGLSRDAATARAALDAASQDSRRVGQELGSARAGLQSAAREKEALARDLSTAHAALNRLSQEKDDIAGDLTTAWAATQRLSEEKDGLASELKAAWAATQRLSEEKDSLATDLEAAWAATERLSQETERVAGELKAAWVHIEKLSEEKDGLGRELTKAGVTVEALALERDALSRDLASARSGVDEALNSRQEIQTQLYLLRSDFQRTVSNLEAAKAKLQDGERAVEEVRHEKDAAAAQATELERKLAEAEKALEQERRLIESERALVDASRASLDHAVKAIESERALGDASRASLDHAVKAIEEAQRSAASELTSQMLTAVGQNASVVDHVSAFRSDLETYSSRLLARLSIVSSDLDTLRRVVKPNDGPGGQAVAELRRLYLDLLEQVLIGSITEDHAMSVWSHGYDPDVRVMGRDWPATAHSMIGGARMRNIRTLVESILDQEIAGDLLEAGVWRGGACIYMRGILEAYGVTDRTVWVADSFEGLPPPTPEAYPADAGDAHHTIKELAVPIEEVKSYFARYGFLDERVVFVKGWFKDTLPGLPVEKLALLRLDGDMYQSTMETLDALYAKVSLGGYVIVDDYILEACRQAVDDFRHKHNIQEPIELIDGAGVYWRKETEAREQPRLPSSAAEPVRRRLAASAAS